MYSIRTQVSTCLGWENLADDTWSGMKKRKAPSKALNGEADCIQPAPCTANRQEVVYRVCFPPLLYIYQQSANSHPFTQLYPRFLCKSKDADHHFCSVILKSLLSCFFCAKAFEDLHCFPRLILDRQWTSPNVYQACKKKASCSCMFSHCMISICLAGVAACLDSGTCQMDYFLLCKN